MKKGNDKKKTNVQVEPLGNGWVVRNANTGKFIVITDNKRDALTVSRGIEKSQSIVLAMKRKPVKKSSSVVVRKSPSRKRTASAKTKKVTTVK